MPGPTKKGRPSRQDELRKAIDDVGVDPSMVDPHRILAALAIDSKVAPATRIQACVALIEHPRKALQRTDEPAPQPPTQAGQDHPGQPDEEINRRAIQIMRGGTGR